MSDPEDTIARLEALGAQTPPAPSDALADRLTAERLAPRASHDARRVLRLPVLLPSVAVAALVLGFVLVTFGAHSGSPTLVLESASNASVEQIAGTVPVAAGTKLVEGTIVVTGPSGSLSAGGVRLGPGERAVVRHHRLERLLRREERREAAASTSTTVAPGDPGATPVPTASASTTTAPRSSTSLPPATLRMLGRRTASGTVELQWTEYSGTDFGGYVVLRGTERSVVARRTDPTRVRAADLSPPAGRTPYVVVVLDQGRHPVARSEVIYL